MVTPIDPQMCLQTGRILTEWFENAEYTDEELKLQAMEKYDIKEAPTGVGFGANHNPSRQAQLDHNRMTSFVTSKRRSKWSGSMSKQEVAHRMNQATKIISPDNAKFLDPETSARTGLELNPLWQMEVIVRSGVLGPKDQIAALKELAGFTHSKAPTLNKNENTNAAPEDWLLELARDQYQTITPLVATQRREKGSGPTSERKRLKAIAEVNALSEYVSSELKEIEDGFDGSEVWEEPE